jgi:YHS domain-containing protein
MLRQTIIALSLITTGLAVAPMAFAEKAPIYHGVFDDLAVGGYDPVAYFASGKPVEGKKTFEYKYKNATWRFASAENLATFKAGPDKYAPQYGGYCAWAAAQGKTAPGDPKLWKLVNGKLYLNYNTDVQKKWEADIPGLVAKADANWPAILKK